MNPNIYAHAIVGWPQLQYVSNLIDSILVHDSSDSIIFVTLTAGDTDDARHLQRSYSRLSRIVFSAVPHDGREWTGSLHDGLNKVFHEANEMRIKYLSVMHPDSQVVRWNDKIVAHTFEIFHELQDCTTILTGFISRGQHEAVIDVFDQNCLTCMLPSGTSVRTTTQSGSDWGFFYLPRWFEAGLTFPGSEVHLARTMSSRGLRTVESQTPHVASIPWPSCIRSGKQYGSIPARKHPLLLRLKVTCSAVEVHSAVEPKDEHPGRHWHEDWIDSWGWWTLSPTWLTHLSLEFARRRAQLRARGKASRLRWVQYGKTPRRIPDLLSIYRPTISDVLSFFLYAVKQKWAHKASKASITSRLLRPYAGETALLPTGRADEV